MNLAMQILISIVFPAVPLLAGIAMIRHDDKNWKWPGIALAGVGILLYLGILTSFPVSRTVTVG